MEIKRISKYSNIKMLDLKELCEFQLTHCKVIQMAYNDENDPTRVIVEYIPDKHIEDYIAEQSGMSATNNTPITPVKSEAQKELETALDTMLNNDPRQKYTGCNLRVPFDRGDWEWINWCLDNMHNEFIRKRIELIKNSGYGA